MSGLEDFKIELSNEWDPAAEFFKSEFESKLLIRYDACFMQQTG